MSSCPCRPPRPRRWPSRRWLATVRTPSRSRAERAVAASPSIPPSSRLRTPSRPGLATCPMGVALGVSATTQIVVAATAGDRVSRSVVRRPSLRSSTPKPSTRRSRADRIPRSFCLSAPPPTGGWPSRNTRPRVPARGRPPARTRPKRVTGSRTPTGGGALDSYARLSADGQTRSLVVRHPVPRQPNPPARCRRVTQPDARTRLQPRTQACTRLRLLKDTAFSRQSTPTIPQSRRRGSKCRSAARTADRAALYELRRFLTVIYFTREALIHRPAGCESGASPTPPSEILHRAVRSGAIHHAVRPTGPVGRGQPHSAS